MKRFLQLSLLLAVLASAGASFAADSTWQAVRLEKGSVFPDAVIVADQPLAHTTQLFPIQGMALVGGNDVAQQTAQVLLNAEFALTAAQSSLTRAVRLNVYLANGAHADTVRKVIADQLLAAKLPALTFVETSLPVPGALVAMDVVAGTEVWPPAGQVNHFRALALGGGSSVSHVSVLPAGRKVYVSGQAVKADTLREATRETFKSLAATLDYLHLGRQHVAQVKAFLKPLARVEEFEQSLVEFFADATVPPLVIVEWSNANPVEIELIAAAPLAAPRGQPVEFTAPPHLKTSPAFSRVAIVNRGRLMFTSSLAGPAAQDAPTQVRESFARLRELVQRSGGDMLNLPKATLYVSSEDSLKAFREIRPDYFDTNRPPASSLANVRGVVSPGSGFVMDIIGVVP